MSTNEQHLTSSRNHGNNHVGGSFKVLICNNCKVFWIAPKTKCDCGCQTLTETHYTNATLAKNFR
jgi:hypothetical protein